MAKKITQTFHKVKALLDSGDKYRDSDEKLVVKIWWDEMESQKVEGKDVSLREISAKAFFYLYREGRFTTADVITRARRKCNELHPETRGKSYKPRKAKVVEVQQEIREITTATVQV